MAKAKEVVEPALAAEVPPAPALVEERPAVRVATFWCAFPRKVKLPSGEVEFKSHKLTITDETLIKELTAICGDRIRIWLNS